MRAGAVERARSRALRRISVESAPSTSPIVADDGDRRAGRGRAHDRGRRVLAAAPRRRARVAVAALVAAALLAARGRGAAPTRGCPARAAASWRSPRGAGRRATPSSPTGAPATKPFRLVRSDGSGARRASARFGVPGADYADVAGGRGRPADRRRPRRPPPATPTSPAGVRRRGGARRGDRRAGARARRHDARSRPTRDDRRRRRARRATAPTTTLTRTGPALPHRRRSTRSSPTAARSCSTRVQSRTRSQLRVLGPGAPGRAGRLGPRPAAARGLDRARRRAASTSPTATAPGGSCSPPPGRGAGRPLVAPAAARARRAQRRAGASPASGCARSSPRASASRGRYAHLPHHGRARRRPSCDPLTRAARIRPRPARRDRPGRPRLRGLDPPRRAVARAARAVLRRVL